MTDAMWALLSSLLPPARTKPRVHDMREVLNGIFYLQKSGCNWRDIPGDLPEWSVCRYYYDKWTKEGVFERCNHILSQQYRESVGKDADPSVLIIDSQSVKTTATGGTKGYDAGKRISGAKRHIAVDTLGLVVVLWHHSASFQDRDAARVLLREAHAEPRCQGVLKWLADGGYAGKLLSDMADEVGWTGEIVKRPATAKGFVVVKKRWIVERTFAWLDNYRRLNKDYERKAIYAETNVWIVMTKIVLGKLSNPKAAA